MEPRIEVIFVVVMIKTRRQYRGTLFLVITGINHSYDFSWLLNDGVFSFRGKHVKIAELAI